MLVAAILTRLALAAAHAPDRVFWTITPARTDPIAAGALIALGLRGSAPRLPDVTKLDAFGASLAICVGAVRFNPGGWGNVVLYPLVATAATVIVVATPSDSPGRLMSSALVVYLRRMSYGWHVYHRLGLELAERALPGTTAGSLCGRARLALLITVTISAASYRWLVIPLMRLKAWFSYVRSRV